MVRVGFREEDSLKIGLGFQQTRREGSAFQVKGPADSKGRCGPS